MNAVNYTTRGGGLCNTTPLTWVFIAAQLTSNKIKIM